MVLPEGYFYHQEMFSKKFEKYFSRPKKFRKKIYEKVNENRKFQIFDFFWKIFKKYFLKNENFEKYFSFRKKYIFGSIFLCELEFFSTIDCTGYEGLVKSPGCSSAFASFLAEIATQVCPLTIFH